MCPLKYFVENAKSAEIHLAITFKLTVPSDVWIIFWLPGTLPKCAIHIFPV